LVESSIDAVMLVPCSTRNWPRFPRGCSTVPSGTMTVSTSMLVGP
jgi:hypothetical protein